MYMSSIQYRASVVMPSGVVVAHCVVSKPEPELEIRRPSGDPREFQRDRAEDAVIDMLPAGQVPGARGQEERVEFPDQLIPQSLVAGQFGHGQRPIPGADLGVVHGFLLVGVLGIGNLVLQRPRREIRGDPPADRIGSRALGPVGERGVRRRRDACGDGQEDGGGEPRRGARAQVHGDEPVNWRARGNPDARRRKRTVRRRGGHTAGGGRSCSFRPGFFSSK